ncbi:Qat anti-phage system TatD family nuclease QatD [Pedobacter hiemivivus]|uniref:TatD family deoxyribonuclease n=1 Tax=Pedobacter hiemivivus TaxID=2530454 RepID=A0A4R0NIN6_9SPHI|nr:Qat anti-phage system TatD family nuclease QatD [Pedobacter hiemivivus]TCC99163.1 TatD family deoxyribonuclease [Pedobacter hiemivivus]
MNLHDTHFHLDLCSDITKMVAQIEREKIYTIAVTNLPDLFHHTKNFIRNTKYIRPSLGFHPELAASHIGQLGKFIALAREAKYIGEIGLDNFKKQSDDYQSQKKIFQAILECCAIHGGKVLSIHSRRAEAEVIAMVGKNYPGSPILHWYSGSIKNLEQALDNGFLFSINYAMTQSTNGKSIVKALPLAHILLESDGPFTRLGDEEGWPGHAKAVVEQIASIKGLSVSEVSTNLIINFKKLVS